MLVVPGSPPPVACGGATVAVAAEPSALLPVAVLSAVLLPTTLFKKRMQQAIAKNVVNITAKGMKTVDPSISLANFLLVSPVK